jgi:midasin
MQQGGIFLIDEISLAEDSVLERLNSVLEAEKTLLLPEKGGERAEEVTAHPNFFVIATMNPSGDFGKRELSPALRNRFTEIWVEPITGAETLRRDPSCREDLHCMIREYLKRKHFTEEKMREAIAQSLFDFLHFYNSDFCSRF